MGKRSLTTIELIVVICLILVFVGTFAVYANITLKVAREITLQNELVNIRMSIQYYQIINARLPEGLLELANQPLTIKASDNTIVYKYSLRPFRVDKEGNLLDPFMQRYVYDERNGTIYSQTKGYERW